MAKQIMIMAVVEDAKDLEGQPLNNELDDDELLAAIQDALVFKHDVCLLVEDVSTTQIDYDWKKANGYQEEDDA